MANVNLCFFIGNLTRDPESFKLPNSDTVCCEFAIAVNRKWKDQSGEQREEVTYLDCKAFAHRAEVIAQYVRKGNPIFVSGYMKQDRWEDKGGGGNRSRMWVIVENFQFLGDPPARGDDNRSGATSPDAQQTQRQHPQRPAQGGVGTYNNPIVERPRSEQSGGGGGGYDFPPQRSGGGATWNPDENIGR